MSNAACVIDLNNGAWIMISIAMICAVAIVYIGCSFGLKFKKFYRKHCKKCDFCKNCGDRATTVEHIDNKIIITDEIKIKDQGTYINK